MKVPIFDKDCLPLPPTPNSKACPEGCLKILVILQICSQASKNKTSFIEFFPETPAKVGSALYSS